MEQKITIPEGFELKQINESEYVIVKKEPELPDTWTEFCRMHPIKDEERRIEGNSLIEGVDPRLTRGRAWDANRNLLPNKEYAEAVLALCQLIQLRDCYRQGWKPDWTVGSSKASIFFRVNEAMKETFLQSNQIFSFQSEEIRDKFLKNFKSLIEKTKPLFM